MHLQRALILAAALFGSACVASRTSPSPTPDQAVAIDTYLRALNEGNPTDPVLDDRDPSVKARLTPQAELRRVQPSPPASGRKPPAEGKALLGGVIERDGSVSSVRVLMSSGNRDFDASSVEALRQWQYRPATIDVPRTTRRQSGYSRGSGQPFCRVDGL